MKVKIFEVIFDGKSWSWVADKNVKIELSEVDYTKIATITTKHPDHGKLVTTVDYTTADIVTIGQ